MTTTSSVFPATTPPTNQAANSTANASADLTQNYNTFLTLLTTQLQNQDPLSPMDSDQFTQQLVEFSQVEQQINTNNNLQQLITLQSAGNTISSLPEVGQQIEYNSPTAPLQSGEASFVYTMPSGGSASTQLTVVDSNGNTVYSTTGETSAGTYVFNWDGKPTGSNQPLPDGGNYTLEIQATSSDGSTVTPTIASIGTVQGFGVQNGTGTFMVNGMSIPLTELVTINPNHTSSNNSSSN